MHIMMHCNMHMMQGLLGDCWTGLLQYSDTKAIVCVLRLVLCRYQRGQTLAMQSFALQDVVNEDRAVTHMAIEMRSRVPLSGHHGGCVL